MEPCIRWAPKAPQALIRSLYESDAAGFQDEALADEVGAALYARCESILAVTRAHETGSAADKIYKEKRKRCNAPAAFP